MQSSGTPVEAWSSPAALAKCPHAPTPNDEPSPDNDSVLWNAMIVPFLRTTLKGAIWYVESCDYNHRADVDMHFSILQVSRGVGRRLSFKR